MFPSFPSAPFDPHFPREPRSGKQIRLFFLPPSEVPRCVPRFSSLSTPFPPILQSCPPHLPRKRIQATMWTPKLGGCDLLSHRKSSLWRGWKPHLHKSETTLLLLFFSPREPRSGARTRPFSRIQLAIYCSRTNCGYSCSSVFPLRCRVRNETPLVNRNRRGKTPLVNHHSFLPFSMLFMVSP